MAASRNPIREAYDRGELKLPTTSTDDPCFRSIYMPPIPASNVPASVNHFIGYRSATLVGRVSISRHRVYGPSDGSGGTVVTLPESSGKLSPDVPELVRIHAEDLYIYAGDTFNFYGRSVHLTVKRLIIVPGDVVDGKPAAVTFNVTGIEGEDKFDSNPITGVRGKDGARGSDGADGDWHHDITAPGAGGDGEVGETGMAGNTGGTFTFCGRVLSLCDTDAEVHVNSKGGTGGKGSRGGRGGDGGNGAETGWKQHEDALDGGYGGRGGPGGSGGPGGQGGSVQIRILPQEPLKIKGKTDQPHGTKAVIFTVDVSRGDVGPPGAPGSGGKGGKGGSWENLAIDANGHRARMVTHSASDGKVGDEGPTGTSVPNDNSNTGEYNIITMEAISLKEDTPESMRQGTTGLEAVLSTRLPLGPFAEHLDPFYLQMILRRLMFEYELVYVSQFDLKFGERKTPASKRFGDSLRWLMGLAEAMESLKKKPEQDSWPTGPWTKDEEAWILLPTASKFKTDRSQDGKVRTPVTKAIPATKQYLAGTSSLLLSCKDFSGRTLREKGLDARDMYDKSYLFVPAIDFDVTRFKDATDAWKELELARTEYVDEINKNQSDEKSLAAKVDKMNTILDSKDKDLDAADKDIGDAYNRAESARAVMKAKQEQFKQTIKGFEAIAALRGIFNGLVKVASSVATCMMFTGGKVDAGNVLNVGTAGAGMITDNDLQIFLEFIDIDENLDGDALSKEIEAKNAPQLAAKHVRLLMVNEAKFRALCDGYFNGIATQAKASFEALVSAAKVYHESLVDYQRKVLAKAQVQLRLQQAQEVKAAVEAVQRDGLPSLMLVYQYYDVVYSSQKARCMRLYYEAIRALTCLKLGKLSLCDKLLTFGSKQNLSAEVMNSMIMVNMADEIDKITNDFSLDVSSEETKTATLTPDSSPEAFGGGLLETGELSPPTGLQNPVTLDITSDNALATLGIDLASLRQVRFVSCSVILRGAVSKSFKGPATSRENWPQVSVNVYFSESFIITDGKDPKSGVMLESKFEAKSGSMTTSYRYNPKNANKTETTSKVPNTEAHMVSLGTAERFPILSPLTVWTITWSDDIDVSKVTAVDIHTTIRARATHLQPPGLDLGRGSATGTNGAGDRNTFAELGRETSHLNVDDSHNAEADEFPKLNAQLAPLHLTSLDYPRVEVVTAPDTVKGGGIDGDLNNIFLPVTPRWIPRVKKHVAVKIPNPLGSPGQTTNEAAHRLLGTLFPTNHPNRMALGSRADRTTRIVGSDAGVVSQVFAKFPRGIQAVGAERDAFEALVDSIDASGAAARFNTVHTLESLGKGHHGIVGGALEVPNAGEIFQDVPGGMRFRAIVYLFAAFAQGSLFIPPAHKTILDTLTTPSEKLSYLLKNEERIGKDGLAFLQQGGRLTDCLIRLGRRNIIGIADVQIKYEGPNKDIIVTSATAVTTAIHVLVGMNRWMLRFDPKRPHEIIFANILEGKHNNMLGDWGNIFLGGRHLLPLTWARMQYLVEGLRKGGGFELANLDKLLAVEAPHLRRCTAWFRYIDFFSKPYVLYKAGQTVTLEFDKIERVDHEPKTLAELDKSPSDLLSWVLAEHTRLGTKPKFYEGPPEIHLLTSVLYGDFFAAPGSNPTTAGDGPLNTLSSQTAKDELQKRVEKHLANLLSNPPTRQAFETAVENINNTSVSSIADKKRSPQALLDLLKGDAGYQMNMRRALQDTLLKKITTWAASEVKDLAAFKDLSGAELYRLIRDSMECHVTSKLLIDDGVVDSYTKIHLLGSTGAATMKQDEIDNLLTSSQNEVIKKSDAVRNAKSATTAARDLDRNDPNRESSLEKAERLERELEQQLEEAEASRDEYKDVDNISKDQDGAKARQDAERAKKEKELVDNTHAER